MKNLAKRLTDLEATADDVSLAHLTDDELRMRIVDIYRELARFGLDLPADWEVQIASDPLAFHRRMKPELEALLCAA